MSNTQCRNFNLPNFVDAAFKELKSDVNLTAGVTIGTLVEIPRLLTLVLTNWK